MKRTKVTAKNASEYLGEYLFWDEEEGQALGQHFSLLKSVDGNNLKFDGLPPRPACRFNNLRNYDLYANAQVDTEQVKY